LVDQVIQLFFDSYGFHEEPLYRHNNDVISWLNLNLIGW
jgi:hypothetical protein